MSYYEFLEDETPDPYSKEEDTMTNRDYTPDIPPVTMDEMRVLASAQDQTLIDYVVRDMMNLFEMAMISEGIPREVIMSAVSRVEGTLDQRLKDKND